MFNQKGLAPLLLILLAAIGIIIYLLISSSAPFKDKLFSRLYPKPPSHAAQNEESVKGLTLAILKINREHSQTPADKKQAVLDRLISNAKNRKEKMLALMEEDPAAALRIALPASLRQQFPDQMQSDIEQETSLEGELEVLHTDEVDDPNSKEPKFKDSKFFYFLKTSGSERVTLHFVEEGPIILTGTKVKVRGVKLDEKMAISQNSDLEILAQSSNVLGTATTKKVAVILINMQNNPVQPYTADFARSVMFTSTTSANAYYQETSFGKLSLEGATRADGDIYGWYTLPYDDTACSSNFTIWGSAAESAAAADGFVRSNYTNVEYAFPFTNACSWWGIADIGGSRTWINGSYTLYVVAHELGHNFGTHHASSYNCTNSAGQRVAISNSCTSNEYGDPFDVMGYSTNHFNNFHKGQLKFLDAVNTQTISSNGDYTIAPIEQTSSGVQALRIPRDVNSSTGRVSSYYYLEYRRPSFFDNFSSTSPVVNGVTVRLAPDYSKVTQSKLIDTTPATNSFDDASLSLNQTLQDPVKGISITTQSVSSTSASVKITLGLPTCARANPTISTSPLSQYGNPGQTLTYTVAVSNNDSSACSPSSFTITPTLPTGFIQSPNPGSITLSPGASGAVSIGLTSDTTIAEGFYTFTETATNSSDTAYKASASANYNVGNPQPTDTTPPTASVTSPLDGSTVKAPSKVLIQADALDNVAISKVDFYVDNSLKCTDIATPYSCSWSVPGKKNASYAITVKAYDQATNQSQTTITVRSL